ncbi:MAG TPA: gamma-glutamyltransferase [Abditibacteriaceae bacterium]
MNYQEFSFQNSFRRRVVPVLAVFCFLAQSASAAWREPVRAERALVASTNRLASQAGVDVMKRGGNAVDAAVATALVLAVVYPQAGNLGGGGFMMIRTRDGRSTVIDYRETAPQRATRTMFLDAQKKPIQGEGSSTVGYRAAGVPGTVAGLALAHQKYGSGKFSWTQIVEPARKLALNGFTVSNKFSALLREKNTDLSRYSETRRIFLRDGRLFGEGEVLRQPELAATLARLQKGGPREFYGGRTAQLIAADMKRNNGLMTLEDLRRYQPKERAPLRGTYRGFPVLTMPPPSSGGAVLLQMLNILEGYDVAKMDPLGSQRYHLLVESMRRGFADRAEWFGDTDFVKVPIEGLVAKDYAAKRRATINRAKASTSAEIRAGKPTGSEPTETTHFTSVDGQGNVVSNTYTLNGNFGSGVVARGTGVLLNNEMDDFSIKPGTPNMFGVVQGERNAVAPLKRPLSSMSPTIVLRKNGRFWFTVGSPGGPTIINTVFQVISNVVDHNMNLQAAIDAPRIHHQWQPDEVVYEPNGLSQDTRRALLTLGHRLVVKPRLMGDAQGVMIEDKTQMRLGASDARAEGIALGF